MKIPIGCPQLCVNLNLILFIIYKRWLNILLVLAFLWYWQKISPATVVGGVMHIVRSRQEGLLTSGLLVITWDFCLESRWQVKNVNFSRIRIAMASSSRTMVIMRKMFVLCLSLQYPTGIIPELGETVIDWHDMSRVMGDHSWHPLLPPCMYGTVLICVQSSG